jgi:SpoVK/Ycf46/Vps4 family AAA+-type ATPase
MKTDIGYLSEVFRIVAGALRLDVAKVRNYTAYLADKLEAAGDIPSARRLRRLLAENDHQLQPTQVAGRTIPVDSETRFPLLVTMKDRDDEPRLVLDQAQQDLVDEFVSVAKSRAVLERQDISTPLTLLVYGPPGGGKSRLARQLASELGLPLYVARLDGLISSFLGSTAKNIRSIFEFAASTPCLLFLDEFDAIAKLRDDSQELGELKRVVNSFLQNLDALGPESVIVAATNHPQLLDVAVWRRFSYRLELPLPNPDARKQLWSLFLGHIFSIEETGILTDLSEGLSGGDIREVSLHLRRRSIALQIHSTLHDAFTSLLRIGIGAAREAALLQQLRNLSAEERAQMLRRRSRRLYSHAHIAALLGTSKATAYRWTQKGVHKNG